jgi:hypothetical protein
MDQWIDNDEPAKEEHEPQVSPSGSNDKNPSDTSPLLLLQVNKLIQDESRALENNLLTQLRAEIKDIVKESMTEI